MRRAATDLQGSYAIAVISADQPDLERVRPLLAQARKQRINIFDAELAYVVKTTLERMMQRLLANPGNVPLLQHLAALAALAVLGAGDMVSVYIREVLIQLWTPDQLRGRVTAVNALLISASNEMGSFRAGWSASLAGPVAATLLGGACTIGVTFLWLLLFPALRRADSLSNVGDPAASA